MGIGVRLDLEPLAELRLQECVESVLPTPRRIDRSRHGFFGSRRVYWPWSRPLFASAPRLARRRALAVSGFRPEIPAAGPVDGVYSSGRRGSRRGGIVPSDRVEVEE